LEQCHMQLCLLENQYNQKQYFFLSKPSTKKAAQKPDMAALKVYALTKKLNCWVFILKYGIR
jgi:hypothetical protein